MCIRDRFIEEDIQKRFLETFHKVDESFQQIFRDLFGGGRGKLNIVEDTLGVEVIAEPPAVSYTHLDCSGQACLTQVMLL